MFKIRSEQRRAFREDSLADFEQRVAAHLHRALPRACEALGEDGLRASIHAGVERAMGYGFVTERDVSAFIDLLVIFGIDFDRRLPWARETLTDPASAEPTARMRALRERAEMES